MLLLVYLFYIIFFYLFYFLLFIYFIYLFLFLFIIFFFFFSYSKAFIGLPLHPHIHLLPYKMLKVLPLTALSHHIFFRTIQRASLSTLYAFPKFIKGAWNILPFPKNTSTAILIVDIWSMKPFSFLNSPYSSPSFLCVTSISFLIKTLPYTFHGIVSSFIPL